MSKTWIDHIQNSYVDLDDFRAYDDLYGLAKRCGYHSARTLWNDNPIIGGSVNPKDFGIASTAEVLEFLKDQEWIINSKFYVRKVLPLLPVGHPELYDLVFFADSGTVFYRRKILNDVKRIELHPENKTAFVEF
jgi:hypothetical protein